jgi:hypothetical protein
LKNAKRRSWFSEDFVGHWDNASNRLSGIFDGYFVVGCDLGEEFAGGEGKVLDRDYGGHDDKLIYFGWAWSNGNWRSGVRVVGR